MLPDWKIRELSLQEKMIDPFVEKQTSKGVISYGLSSYGYDARLASKFKIFHNIKSAIIDPKTTAPDYFIEHEGDHCIIPPNSYVLSHTVERFKIPRDVLAICLGKSTYARWGIIVNVTPLEPEWEGVVTLEISNSTPSPVKIYAGEGICQMVFLDAHHVGFGNAISLCETSYADRQGKYQGQDGITLGKVNAVEEIKREVVKTMQDMQKHPRAQIYGNIEVPDLAHAIGLLDKMAPGTVIKVMRSDRFDEVKVLDKLRGLPGEYTADRDLSNDHLIIRRKK